MATERRTRPYWARSQTGSGLGFCSEAKELLLCLQGAGAEHLLSLRIWHNQPLLNALKQLMPTMKETFPHEDQQIDERMARIMEHPSLKSLLGEEEDGAMMRGAIIILLAYWIDSDHEDKTLKDVLSIDNQDGSENLCIENIACGVEIGSGLANILEDLLKLVRNPPLALDEDCKAHFKIVNIAWKHNQLISLLLKKRHVIHKIQRYSNVSSQQLRESLTPLVKAHPLIKDILQESEASSVRGA